MPNSAAQPSVMYKPPGRRLPGGGEQGEESLARLLGGSPYQGYAYGYPHKMAYRPLTPALDLAQVWAEEPKDSLFLYVHIPFCEMRCGFCNLFTTTRPGEDFVTAYLSALAKQALGMARALRDEEGPTAKPRFTRGALGGGTPTFLSLNELEGLYDSLDRAFGDLNSVPWSVEMSPATVTAEKLQLLLGRGMRRASIGVQSFVPAETKVLGRPQDPGELRRSLKIMRECGARVLNIDLIYGAEGQTEKSWICSLKQALEYRPEELYLYPLYVRPLTGLGRRAGAIPEETGDGNGDPRLRLYRIAREFLAANGYRQISMRLFRAAHFPDFSGPEYCCQDDGMVGLGAGARSYTRSVHYSTEYAVGRPDIQSILRHYVEDQQSADSGKAAAAIGYGFILNEDEQRRRYIIKSLLRCDGLDARAFDQRFGMPPEVALPQLALLGDRGLAVSDESSGIIRLTQAGFELSDAIGPWLYSVPVCDLMASYELS